MDSHVTYLQITSAESGRVSLLQLPPSPPRLSFFPLWMLFAANAGVGGGGPRLLYWGWEPAAPPPAGRQDPYRPPAGR